MPLINEEVIDETDDESIEENEPVETKKKPTVHHKIMTDCGQEIIIKKSRSTKKQNIQKPIILYAEDLVPAMPPQQVIVKQKKGKGRPKKKPIVEYVNKNDEIQSDDDGDIEQVIINKPKKEKLSKKDLKMLELQEKILELETVSGKKIRGTKKGNIDKRQTKPATEKQIAARKKFVEDNRLRREAQKKKKEEEKKLQNKDNVKDVINELAELKKQNAEQKAQIMKEIQNKKQQEAEAKEAAKPANPYANLV
jgi:flagellar biosynthesis GTPase FlhF